MKTVARMDRVEGEYYVYDADTGERLRGPFDTADEARDVAQKIRMDTMFEITADQLRMLRGMRADLVERHAKRPLESMSVDEANEVIINVQRDLKAERDSLKRRW